MALSSAKVRFVSMSSTSLALSLTPLMIFQLMKSCKINGRRNYAIGATVTSMRTLDSAHPKFDPSDLLHDHVDRFIAL